MNTLLFILLLLGFFILPPDVDEAGHPLPGGVFMGLATRFLRFRRSCCMAHAWGRAPPVYGFSERDRPFSELFCSICASPP